MSGNRREINRQEITGQVKAKFLTFYAQGGIDRVSVGALCEACGIARSTFYYYFDDKYAVLEAIEEELIGTLWRINTEFEWKPEEMYQRRPSLAAAKTIQYLEEHTETFRVFLGPHGDPAFTYKWKKGLEQHFFAFFVQEKGDALAAEAGCTIFTSATIGLFSKYVFGKLDLSTDAFAVMLGNLLQYCLFDFHAFSV